MSIFVWTRKMMRVFAECDARLRMAELLQNSYSLLAAVMKLSAHMCGLVERMRGPRFDCFGPWPMCPASVADMF